MGDVYRKLRKYFQSPADVWIFVRVAFWIAALPNLLDKRPLDELVKRLGTGRRDPSMDVNKVTVYVNWWLNWKILMFRPTCLKRSLVMYKFLREAGRPVRIHYGIRKNGGKNDGHSWLTLDGELLPPDGETAHLYMETFSYPPRGEAR